MSFTFFYHRMHDLAGDKGNLTNMILRNSPNFDNTPRAVKSNPITKSRRISFTTVSGVQQEGSTELTNTPSRRINPTPVSGKPFRRQTNAFIEQDSAENKESSPGCDPSHLEEERELLRLMYCNMREVIGGRSLYLSFAFFNYHL